MLSKSFINKVIKECNIFVETNKNCGDGECGEREINTCCCYCENILNKNNELCSSVCGIINENFKLFKMQNSENIILYYN